MQRLLPELEEEEETGFNGTVNPVTICDFAAILGNQEVQLFPQNRMIGFRKCFWIEDEK